MTTAMKIDGRLSYKEKELVALGASLAAGCIPCTRHHVGEVQGAGASQEEIDRAIDAALCVKSSTRGIMERTVREALGSPAPADPSCCAGATDRMRELVSIAAAVAVNCPTNLEKHVRAGRDVGVGDDEVQIAIGLGRAMRNKASEKVDAAAAALAASEAGEPAGCCEGAAASAPAASTGCCAPAEIAAAPTSAVAAKSGCC
jgi:AhpD family alkylhydroperoxidase